MNYSSNNDFYTEEAHKVWTLLIKQQTPLIMQFACNEYLNGLEALQLPEHNIPNINEISNRLYSICGWSLVPVEKIVSDKEFFLMLAHKQFPVIRAIRPRDEIDFYKDESPDIFHELFGHCPMIANQAYADCLYKIGKYSLCTDNNALSELMKIYWVTFEFGLLKTMNGFKIYGAGILPSKMELLRAIKTQNVSRIPLTTDTEIIATLKGNISQPIYYTISDFNELYKIIEDKINR